MLCGGASFFPRYRMSAWKRPANSLDRGPAPGSLGAGFVGSYRAAASLTITTDNKEERVKNPQDSYSGPLGWLLQRLPGGGRARRRLGKARRRLLHAIEQRLGGEAGVPAVTPRQPEAAAAAMPGDLLRGLLAASEEQSREQAETAFFSNVLHALTPDQARILSALSGGASYPLIHVFAGSRLGLGMQPVLECISSVGKSAGVSCPDLTPVYVQGLLGWGLAEIEAVEGPDTVKYELLETETTVRKVLEQLKQSGRGSRILRRTLKMSALGDRLWAVCRFADSE